MPGAVFDPGRGGFVETEFHRDGLAAHDPDGIFDVVLDIKVQRHLKRMIGEGDRFDAFHREHAHVFSEMAIADEIEGAVGVPQTIGADFPSGGLISGRGKVPHLHRVEFIRGFNERGDGGFVRCVRFMGTHIERKDGGELAGGGPSGFGTPASALAKADCRDS